MKNKNRVSENKVAVNKMDWYLDRHGILYISGEGKTPDYSCGNNPAPPWEGVRNQIRMICIGEGITEIGSRSFELCENLEKVLIPNSLEQIHYECFKDCGNLREIIAAPEREFYFTGELPYLKKAKKTVADRRKGAGFRDIVFGNNAFRHVPWAIERWGKFYIKESGLYTCFEASETLKIPDGVETIHEFAFKDWDVSVVEFPDSLKRIEQCAFANTKIKRILLPDNIEYVGGYAFADSPLEKVIIMEGTESTFEKDAFARTCIPRYWYLSKRLPEGYRLISEPADPKLHSIDIYKKLRIVEKEPEIQKETGETVGIVSYKHLKAGYSIMRRVYMGSLILGIKYDEVSKVVLNVKSLYYDRYNDRYNEHLSHKCVVYPCMGEKDGDVKLKIGNLKGCYLYKETVYKDFFVKSVPDDLVHEDDIRRITDRSREEWYSTRHWSYQNGEQEMMFLERWLKEHPDYRVEYEGEKPEEDKLRRFIQGDI